MKVINVLFVYIEVYICACSNYDTCRRYDLARKFKGEKIDKVRHIEFGCTSREGRPDIHNS